LRARGHRALTPTMTGATLSAHVGEIVDVLRNDDVQNAVLCGHSYGGLVISGVVEAVPERVGALVFLDAFVPGDGQSLHDLVAEAQRARQIEAAAANDGFVPPVPAEVFGVNEADRAYVDSMCVPQPLATFREGLRLTGARERVAHKTYLRAGTYRSIPFDAARDAVSGAPGWVVDTIPSGHDVMLDAPAELAVALIAAAERAGLA
jgi:pimeloyl-ACP methyl ester carboxylesterase